MSKPEEVVFTETDASWVHQPYEDTLKITKKGSHKTKNMQLN